MDSGNSESLQSSSGGDDEYGLCAADSSFLSPIFNPLSQSQPSPMFDPLSNYFDPPISSSSSRPHNPNPLLNLDMVWPKFHPNPSDPNPTNPFFNPQTQTLQFAQLTQNTPPSVTATAASSSMLNAPADQAQSQVARNPKKRSRASRRAPTTVLTTDTTNFRAMVQEFTGIPAPPFTSSSPFPRTRLDLFGTPSSIRSNPSSTSQPPPYHNLLRPFPQKSQPLLNGTNNITTTTSSTCQLGLLNPPRATSKNSLNNMQIQSPILTFQSFLQSPKYPLHEIASNDSSHLKMGVRVLDEFGLTHGPQLTNSTNNNNAHIISGLVSSDRASPRNENGDGSGYNYSGSSSNFHSSKGLADNVSVSVSVSTTRGEGLNMESWICSSD